VNGCALCPAGSFVDPTRAGCSEYSWCCTKVTPSVNDCTQGGGVCVEGNNPCPDKWEAIRTSCGTGMNTTCCAPKKNECPAYPKKCIDMGGVCTNTRWDRCPLGTEPNSLGTDQLGCENQSGGWCCVDGPPSTCADSAQGGMCVPGDKCTGCFAAHPDSSLTCEAGRVCCVDICD
jgi:hypothetical protein